jgi:diaminopimelate decarboxylase
MLPDGRKFAVLDAGMAELLRPALYGSFTASSPLFRETERERMGRRGPICESSDVFARERPLPPLEVVTSWRSSTPARTAPSWRLTTMASAPAEVLVDEGTWSVIRGARRSTMSSPLKADRGLLIAFEGLDQSGKQTQAELLRIG